MPYFCIDVGGTMIKYALLDENEAVLEHDEIPTQKESKEEFISSISNLINNYLSDFDIKGIGISFPGHIVPETGVALQAGAIGVLSGCNVLELLREKLIQPDIPMVIENDANCAAIAEAYSGRGQDCDDFCLITIGTGIGGAFVHDKRIVHGHSYKAGELGMMIIDYQESGYKTLHDLASTSALVREYKILKGLPEDALVHGAAIFEDEDLAVKTLIQDWSTRLALAIFNVVCQNDPDKVLLGGGISRNPQLLPNLLAALEKNPFWDTFQLPIAICQHQNLAGLLGAYHLLKHKGEE